MSKPLSERLMNLVVGCDGPNASLIREAAALARRVEGAPSADVIDGGMMIRPFRQYGRFSLPDDGDNPSTKEARFLGQFVGQRVAIVPVDSPPSTEGGEDHGGA